MKLYSLSSTFSVFRVDGFVLDTTWPEFIEKNKIELEKVFIQEINKSEHRYAAWIYFSEIDPNDAKDILIIGIEEYYNKVVYPQIKEEMNNNMKSLKEGMKDKEIKVGWESEANWKKVMG